MSWLIDDVWLKTGNFVHLAHPFNVSNTVMNQALVSLYLSSFLCYFLFVEVENWKMRQAINKTEQLTELSSFLNWCERSTVLTS